MQQLTASDSIDDGRITAEISHTQNTNSGKWRTSFSAKLSEPIDAEWDEILGGFDERMEELLRKLRTTAISSHNLLLTE